MNIAAQSSPEMGCMVQATYLAGEGARATQAGKPFDYAQDKLRSLPA